MGGRLLGRVGKETLMGIIWGRGRRTWGKLFGGELWWGSSWSDESKREKKEIGKVQLFTKTIPSGVQVNNIILDNTEIINCHKSITTHEQTDG